MFTVGAPCTQSDRTLPQRARPVSLLSRVHIGCRAEPRGALRRFAATFLVARNPWDVADRALISVKFAYVLSLAFGSHRHYAIPAFAAERPAPAGDIDRQIDAAPAAVDRYLLPAGSSAANQPHAAVAVDRRDRRTDTRPYTHTDILLRILCGQSQ